MIRLLACLALIATPALADGAVTVKLPSAEAVAKAASADFLTRLVMANVAGMNCPGYALSDGEWALITGTADKVAAALKLDTGTYDDQFYAPAFAAIDQPGTCDAEGPKIAPLIDRLRSMGGGTDPIG
ncbi:MAG: hypothetical protein IPL38_06190 [Rhodobacter sp.]|jgi:hypothetical protein|nr:hypothetical protein [Rhodobacter sp.]MBK8439109.1 hypothetical protein [Rhodobacter sp.]